MALLVGARFYVKRDDRGSETSGITDLLAQCCTDLDALRGEEATICHFEQVEILIAQAIQGCPSSGFVARVKHTPF